MTTSSPRPGAVQRAGFLLYGIFAYLGFHAVFLAMILFLNDWLLPVGVSAAPSRATLPAIAIDLGLIALFGLQHAVMARPAFKRAWTRVVPEPIERSTFVLATVLCLGAAIVLWQPVGGTLLRVETPALRDALYAVQAAGWAILVYTTFLIDHFELFGLRQVWCAFRRSPLPVQQFREPSLYRYSRHPMMLGLLIGLWATPDLTASRLLWAAGFTAYVLVGIRLEERDLVAHLGERYREYQACVPRLLPRLPAPRSRSRQPSQR